MFEVRQVGKTLVNRTQGLRKYYISGFYFIYIGYWEYLKEKNDINL